MTFASANVKGAFEIVAAPGRQAGFCDTGIRFGGVGFRVARREWGDWGCGYGIWVASRLCLELRQGAALNLPRG